MNPFKFKYNGKKEQTGEETGQTIDYKTQVIVIWAVLKILVDKIMVILPESFQDNGYYIAQSAWLLVLFIMIFNSMKKFYQLMAMVAVIIYQLVDLITEIYLLYDAMTISSCIPLIWGASSCSLLIVAIILFSKYYDN